MPGAICPYTGIRKFLSALDDKYQKTAVHQVIFQSLADRISGITLSSDVNLNRLATRIHQLIVEACKKQNAQSAAEAVDGFCALIALNDPSVINLAQQLQAENTRTNRAVIRAVSRETTSYIERLEGHNPGSSEHTVAQRLLAMLPPLPPQRYASM